MITSSPEIVVAGSANLDLVVPVERHPTPGETVLGGDVSHGPGGKGANQATAAARLGRRTAFVGCVGSDDAGRQLRESLHGAGVDTSHLITSDTIPTGVALIAVAAGGDNTIVVSPGANRDVDGAVIEQAAPTLRRAEVLLLQLEIPIASALAAARLAPGLVILNPAPAPHQPLPPELLAHTGILVPNETELAALTGADPAGSPNSLAAAARRLPVDVVVVTLGAKGALLVTGDDEQLVPTPAVTPVDTTAAGDAFCAGLADALVDSPGDLLAAVRWAVRVGTATTLVAGAAASLPSREDVRTRLPEDLQ